jgi:hypothetical protein
MSNNGRDSTTGRFLTGNIGGGRSKGSRNKLATEFIDALYEQWLRSGPKVLRTVAETDPVAFMKCVASILPRQIEADVNVDVDLFAECRTFNQAYQIAKRVIGIDTDDAPLIPQADDDEETQN